MVVQIGSQSTEELAVFSDWFMMHKWMNLSWFYILTVNNVFLWNVMPFWADKELGILQEYIEKNGKHVVVCYFF